MTNTVWLVQNQHMMDKQTGQLVPKYNIESLKEYGTLRFLLSPNASPFNTKFIIKALHEQLANFTDKDSLVLMGNPALIGFAVAIAAMYNDGRVNLLQWNGTAQRHLPIEADLLNTGG